MTTYRTKGRGKDRKVYPIRKSTRRPYGVERAIAAKEVQELRDRGERARLIETNRRLDLYAAYEGVTPQVTTQSKKEKGPEENKITSESQKKKMTYEEAAANMKPVPIHLRISGEPRKGSIYAAVITGSDPKYGLKREFLKGERTYTGKHDLTVDYEATLKPGTIIETGEGGSWKNSYGKYYVVTSKGVKPFRPNYNGEGKLEIKDLMKRREAVASRQNNK
ncbi:hypothetical protein ACNF40_02975 [Cuniculiplasma sp. SKW4]|uniref:hypothetical protein n=1 Tax=Cuniculiplasma sp. SKW4 TaxID=3400171 RepID=UPI003FD1ABD6